MKFSRTGIGTTFNIKLKKYDKLPIGLKEHCRVYIISSSVDEQDVAKANRDKNILAMEEKPITKEFLKGILDKLKALPYSNLFL